jgi:hypothetical protein
MVPRTYAYVTEVFLEKAVKPHGWTTVKVGVNGVTEIRALYNLPCIVVFYKEGASKKRLRIPMQRVDSFRTSVMQQKLLDSDEYSG